MLQIKSNHNHKHILIQGLTKKYEVAIYKTTGKLCRMLKLCQTVAVCFTFISYKFQHQLNCSVFHRVFFSCVNMMDFEQHAVIKFLSKRNKTNVEIENELSEVWGDAAYKKSTVQKWTKRFCEGRESLQDNDSVDCPFASLTDEKVKDVCELIWSDQQLTVGDKAEECHISYSSV